MNTTRNNPEGKGLEATLARLNKQHGAGVVMRYGDRSRQVARLPTGSLSIDLATGIGGYPRGRIVEVYGPESSGKTTLTLHAIAACQRAGGVAAFVDAEHALDPAYAEALGVDLDALVVSQPDHAEQALQVVEQLVASNELQLVVIDSVAALVPKAEIEGDMGDLPVGLQARLMSQALRKLTGVCSRTGTTVMFINQLRQKIGVTFGNGEVTTGGNALKFYATMRIDIRRIGAVKVGAEVVGNRTRLKVVKNKLAPPYQKAEFDILYGVGISPEAELIDLGLTAGLVTRSGSWYSMGESRLGQGKDKAMLTLAREDALREQLRLGLLTAHGLAEPVPEA